MDDEKKFYTCIKCGETKSEDEFYTNINSSLWDGLHYNGRIPYCKDCIQERYKEIRCRFESDRKALLVLCYTIDIPFDNVLFDKIIKNGASFNIGRYLNSIRVSGTNKTFTDSLLSDEVCPQKEEVVDTSDSQWSKDDKQNKSFVLSYVGYNPFANCGMNDIDLKYCFNTLSSYLSSDGIQDDGHKLQSVIQLTQSNLQCKKMNEMVNQELLKTNSDSEKLKKLIATKKQLMDEISTIAKENNISSAHSLKSKQGSNTLAGKMREMLDSDYENAKVNLFDIKTSEAMKQIADLSNQSILEQINLDSNEYTQMIGEQRDMILKLQSKSDELFEENRMLKNQVIDLKQNRK